MKIQDIFLIGVLIFLVFFKRDSRLFGLIGIILLILSIPFFSLWIFFTAQRFVWYGLLFLFVGFVFKLRELTRDE